MQKMMEAGFSDLGARSHSDHSSEGLDGLKVESGGDGSPDSPMPDDRHDSQAQHLRLTHDDAAARLKQLVGEMSSLLEAHGLPGNSYLCAPHPRLRFILLHARCTSSILQSAHC